MHPTIFGVPARPAWLRVHCHLDGGKKNQNIFFLCNSSTIINIYIRNKKFSYLVSSYTLRAVQTSRISLLLNEVKGIAV
jgi:hypothetical protein